MEPTQVVYVHPNYMNDKQIRKDFVPVIPLDALKEVVDGLNVLADCGTDTMEQRHALERVCFNDGAWWDKYGQNGIFSRWLAQRLLAQLEEGMK